MEVLLLAGIIVGVWLVLNHLRKQLFLKEFMELQRQALEKGVALPGNLEELATVKPDWAGVSLRVGIISIVLGIMGVIIGGVILPSQTWHSMDTDTPAIFAIFWGFGLLLAAFGVGNLICWFFIDRKAAKKRGGG